MPLSVFYSVFLLVLWVGLWSVIVAFPGHVHLFVLVTVNPVLKIDKTKILMTNSSLMKVEGIAECPWSILQYYDLH